MSKLDEARAALERVKKAPVSPDGMRSPEEPPAKAKPRPKDGDK